jgi:hypothetical protein
MLGQWRRAMLMTKKSVEVVMYKGKEYDREN